MKRLLYLTGSLVLVAIILLTIDPTTPTIEAVHPALDVEQYHEERAHEAAEYIHMLRANPQTGKFDPADYYKALHQANEMKKASRSGGVLNLVWEEQGPDNVGGRTRAVLVDKDNPNKIYAGGVAGGLWVSMNGGQSWDPVPGQDNWPNLAVASIAQATNGDIYVGTGEGDLYQATGDKTGGIPGFGMYKSGDGGNTFAPLNNTQPLPNTAYGPWSNISKIATHPTQAATLFAATTGGIKASYDGGATWEQPAGTPILPATDVKIASDGSVVYASIDDVFYRSDDGGTTFSNETIASFGQLPSGNNGVNRMEFAVAKSDPNYVYCSISRRSNSTSDPFGECIFNIYQSTDKGQNWTKIGQGGDEDFDPFANGAQCQGDFDHIINVSTTDPEMIYVGGVSLWRWSDNFGWDQVDVYSIATGFEFQYPYYVHADKHAITFDPNDGNTMYVGCDGGVFKSLNAHDKVPEFQNLNKGYNVTQYYGIGSSIDGTIIGGTQDNGTQLMDGVGNTIRTATRVNGGDGGFSEISNINPNVLFAATPPSEDVGNLFRSTNRGKSFVAYYDNHIDCQPFATGSNECQGDRLPDNGAGFVAPYLLWEHPVNYFDPTTGDSLLDVANSVSRVVAITTNQVWLCEGAATNLLAPEWFQINTASLSGGVLTAVAISDDGNWVYVGNTGGRVYRIGPLRYVNYVYNNINQWEAADSGIGQSQVTNSALQGVVTSIAVNPENENEIVVTTGSYGVDNHVYHTINAASAAPTSIQGDLPPMPVYGAVINKNNANVIVVGTDLGIWTTSNGGTSWTEDNDGMARVPVFSLRSMPLNDADCDVIYAGTHGRGIFRTVTLTGAGCDTQQYWSIDDPETENSSFTVFPNPMRDQATVKVELTERTTVDIIVYDLQGRVVNAMQYGEQPAGVHQFDLNNDRLSAGTYVVTLRTAQGQSSTKVIVAK